MGQCRGCAGALAAIMGCTTWQAPGLPSLPTCSSVHVIQPLRHDDQGGKEQAGGDEDARQPVTGLPVPDGGRASQGLLYLGDFAGQPQVAYLIHAFAQEVPARGLKGQKTPPEELFSSVLDFHARRPFKTKFR
jgi:hypothetical protein